MNIKQVIVIRKDLKMRRGKEIAQGAHASMAWLTSRIRECCWHSDVPDIPHFSQAEEEWVRGAFAKVVVRVESEEELLEIHNKAKEAGLVSSLIQDAGRTEFKEPTYTAVGIGPDEADKIDKITGDLKLY